MKFLTLIGVLIVSSLAQAGGIPANPAGCTDFSGTWKGACVTNGVITPIDHLEVRQYACNTLYVNSIYYPIGGSHYGGNWIPMPNGDVVTSAVTALGWNADHTMLLAETRVQAVKAGVGTTYYDQIYSTSRLVDGKLYLYAKSRYYESACELQ